MPSIRPYQMRSEVSGPVGGSRRSGEDFGGAVGEGMSRFGQAVMQTADILNQRAEQQEVSDLNAKLSKAQADFTTRWQERLKTADPADTSVAEGFGQELDEYMSELGGNVSTRAGQLYFEKASAQMKGHFSMTAAAGQAELQGVKAKQDYIQSVTDLSSSLINDPSSFDLASQMHDDGLEMMVATGRLPRASAEELKTRGQTDLAKSAVRGWIRLDPEGAKAQLEQGKWDGKVDGDLKHQLFGEASQAIRAKEIDQERQVVQAKKARDEYLNVLQGKFLEKLAKGSLTVQDVLRSDLESFGSGSKQQFMNLLEAETKEGGNIKTDPAVWSDTFKRIHAKDGDPNKITNEADLNDLVIQKKLSFEDLNRFRGEMAGRKTMQGQMESTVKKQFLDMAEKQISKANPMMGIADPIGAENAYKFHFYVEQKLEEQKKAGKPIQDLFNPNSPQYLGHEIGRYQRSVEEIMGDISKPRGTNGAVPPTPTPSPTPSPKADNPNARQPGETIDAWKKRTKGK